jgi:hypothetical protein
VEAGSSQLQAMTTTRCSCVLSTNENDDELNIINDDPWKLRQHHYPIVAG